MTTDKLGDKLTPLLDFKFEEVKKATHAAFTTANGDWRQAQVIGSRHLMSDWNSRKDEFIAEMAHKLNELNKECNITHIFGDWLNGIAISGGDRQLESEYVISVYYVQDRSPSEEAVG